MEQDDFSNVTWSDHVQEQTANLPPPAERPGHTMQGAGTAIEREAPELGNEKLQCTVGTPLKENDGSKDAFVSYLITTHVSACECARGSRSDGAVVYVLFVSTRNHHRP